VVSPLSRAIETGLIGFPTVPVVANPLCREILDNSCDIGLLKTELIERYPNIDFGLLPDGPWWYCPEDGASAWDHLKAGGREPESEIHDRIEAFAEWLWSQPETEIAIVAHTCFLQRMLGGHMANCEVKSRYLVDTDTLGASGTKLRIPGGG